MARAYGGLIEGADPTIAALTGRIDVRFADTTLIDLAAGGTPVGGGPEYCRACRDDDLPCARGEPGADGRLCPYREHALISHQEHETWEVLAACQGQIRLAPSGHIIGIGVDAALRVATARGCDLAVLSELLPAAEAGLVEAWSGDGRRSGAS